MRIFFHGGTPVRQNSIGPIVTANANRRTSGKEKLRKGSDPYERRNLNKMSNLRSASEPFRRRLKLRTAGPRMRIDAPLDTQYFSFPFLSGVFLLHYAKEKLSLLLIVPPRGKAHLKVASRLASFRSPPRLAPRQFSSFGKRKLPPISRFYCADRYKEDLVVNPSRFGQVAAVAVLGLLSMCIAAQAQVSFSTGKKRVEQTRISR